MKRLFAMIAVVATTLVLAACGNLTSAPTTGGSSNNKTQLTGESTGTDYQGVIKNGHYLTSKARGVTNSQDDNAFNLKSFEAGLLNLSKDEFSPKKYVFQEGQTLSSGTVQDWLGRKSKSNPDGLNPVDNGKKGADTRNPIYLQTLEEQDFMTQNGGKLSLAGMTIGLGLNSVDNYQKEKYGATYKTEISDAQMKAQGKKMAGQILQRMRKYKVANNLPIMIALYKQAPDDSLVGGTFFTYSVTTGSKASVGTWKKVSQENAVLPTPNGSKAVNSTDASAFDNFKTQVQNFFPNLSGVTAQAHYSNGALAGMTVNVTTQFYSQTEITSFTQYLQQAAQKYLPGNVPINIQVSSAEGMQSFLSRKQGDKSFESHVFNSY